MKSCLSFVTSINCRLSIYRNINCIDSYIILYEISIHLYFEYFLGKDFTNLLTACNVTVLVHCYSQVTVKRFIKIIS